VNADDPASIADAFDRLATERALRESLASGAIRRGHEVAWVNEEGRLAAIIERVLGRVDAHGARKDGDRAA
jgi:hypothetical protein